MVITVTLQQAGAGFKPASQPGPFCLHVLLMCVWVSSWSSGFPVQRHVDQLISLCVNPRVDVSQYNKQYQNSMNIEYEC